jgi:ribosome biogenesis protein ERB1
MATASDDGTVHVFHARVFSDFLQNPVIVPVKILRGHAVTTEGLGVLDACFHPRQPWLFTAGADKAIHLWHDMH